MRSFSDTSQSGKGLQTVDSKVKAVVRWQSRVRSGSAVREPVWAPQSAQVGNLAVVDFIETGSDLSSEDLAHAKWPLRRPPYLLETAFPGVFAVGDVRAGNVKRVAISGR